MNHPKSYLDILFSPFLTQRHQRPQSSMPIIENNSLLFSSCHIDNGAELGGATGAIAPLVFWSQSQKKSRKVSKSKSRSPKWHQLFLPSFGANVGDLGLTEVT